MPAQFSAKISVIIPVKNEAKKISACLEGILSQITPVFEIIVIDSGSSDGTQKIASEYPKVRVVDIPPEEFNHGVTRNLGVKLAKGDYILFTVGDARPVDNQWTKKLLDGFTDDAVAGVCGLQVVSHDKDTNPTEWYRPVNKKPAMKRYQYSTPEKFETASSEEKRASCGWDDVSAMYRRKILEEMPFKNLVYGEDVYWAIDAFKAGFTLVYNPQARVYHFHNENFETTFKRTISVCYLRYVALGIVPDEIEINKIFIFNVYRLIREKNLNWKETIFWIKYNFNLIRAIGAGLKYFDDARVNGGAEGLEILHRKYCGSPPIPIK